MNSLEEKIWTSVYAAQYISERNFKIRHLGTDWAGCVDTFHCAEIADEAVEAFRQLKEHEDYSYLLLAQEE